MRKVALILSLLLPQLAGSTAQAKVELKIATVAPNGSAWMRLFKKMNAKIKKATGGEVALFFYPGQVQGDERDVVRKIRTGQLHGGSFTSVGLAMINPKVLVLQLPLMFESAKQLNKVRKALHGDFEKSFRDKGFELLGWGDIGWVYIFTNAPVNSKDALKKQKVWAWQDDPLTKAMFKEAGVKPKLLGLPQVYPALNTGMINAVYNAPLAALTLQWHTKVKYYTDFPLAIAVGATVVIKKNPKPGEKGWDDISPEHQEIVKKICRKYHRALTKRVHKDNVKALKILQKTLKPVPITAAKKKEFKDIAMKVAKKFVPRYYSQALLNKVLKLRK